MMGFDRGHSRPGMFGSVVHYDERAARSVTANLASLASGATTRTKDCGRRSGV